MKGKSCKSRYIGISKPPFNPGVRACKGCKYLDYRNYSCRGMHQKVEEIKRCPIGGVSTPRKLIHEWKPTDGLMSQMSLANCETACMEAE